MIKKHLVPAPDTPPVFANVVQWLEKGAAEHSNSIALSFDGRELTYAEFDRLSNRIGGCLVARGVAPGDAVGLCLDRSIEMVAAVAGILKAGAAYVPLDPAYPVERLAMMVEDARVRFVLVHEAHAERFENALVWETVAAEAERCPDTPPAVPIGPESPAYIIFTSGSTGRPKGIEMPHRALANLIEWQLERKTFRPAARVLQYSSISFDVSFQEMATTLASGGTLYLISNDDRKDPRTLLAQLIDRKIERLFLPYVAMRSIIEAAHMIHTYPETLQEIITAGEQLRVDEVVRDFFRRIDGASLDNQYGPSETHVITANLLEGDPSGWPDLPGIGTPLKNCGTCILDENLQPVAEGEEGELYLAGRNLAHGYIGREELTKSVFIPNPFEVQGGPVLYKTGDLASYNPDGSIEFLGRRDHQIKIRGHRIEPGEINNAVSDFPGVGQSLAHAHRGTDGILQLVAYYQVKEGEAVDVSNLRKHLTGKLPDYMLPAFLIEIAEIPYTPSGKVDLKALPEPSIENSRFAGVEVRYETETEERLSKVWNELLGLDAIPREADFFELGGDSLRAVTLFLRIDQLFGKDLPLSTLTHTSTLAALAALIDGRDDLPDLSDYRALKLLQKGEADRVPLFLVHGGQGNVLVFNEFVKMLEPDRPVYAFQWPGWDGFAASSDVNELARQYCDELQRFIPGGRLRLGGYCIGGLIAVEMARLLEERGFQREGPLVVWDAPNLKASSYRKEEPWDSAEIIAAFNRMKSRLAEVRLPTTLTDPHVPNSDFKAPAGKGALIRRLPGLIGLLRWVKAMKYNRTQRPRREKTAAYLKRNEALPMELRPDYCLDCMVKAAKHHRSRGFSGDVLYFRSDCVVSRYFGLTGWWDDLYLGFGELCNGTFEAYAVGGGHTDVVLVPEMGQLVREHFQCLEK